MQQVLQERMFKRKTLILLGPRQVGKTTLVNSLLDGEEKLFLNGDDPIVRQRLSVASTSDLAAITGKYKIVFIDEAQRIENIGLTAKLIHDQFPEVQLILSGSSAFELRNNTNESLTGRKWERHLYPISYQEYEAGTNYLTAESDLENRLIYGFYPDVLNNPSQSRETLTELSQSVLFKDVLNYGGIKKPDVLDKLLKALAFQVGNEVSFNEVAQTIGVDKNTVSSYIRLLEMAFVVFPLTTFSRNLRNEIKTNRKYYFYDNGIRNAILQNFNPIINRNDIGALWENFLIAERRKRNEYFNYFENHYFWRTKSQQEVDYVEETNGKISGFEFKWNPKARVRIPQKFVESYEAEVQVITRANFRDFVIFPEA